MCGASYTDFFYFSYLVTYSSSFLKTLKNCESGKDTKITCAPTRVSTKCGTNQNISKIYS